MKNSIRAASDEFSIDVDAWRHFFEQKVRKQPLIDGYLAYVEDMGRRGLPPIFEQRHLGLLLGVSPSDIFEWTKFPSKQYRSFSIPKRSGGTRTISTTWPALLSCQRWIDAFILRKLGIHNAAHAYVEDRSNLTNAKVHLHSSNVLCLDIVDFFGSINQERIQSVFVGAGYPPHIAFLLTKLCTLNGCLPQGAPTSPRLCNIAFKRTDDVLSVLARSNSLKYTRYADDLTFSGEYIDQSLITQISGTLEAAGFKLRKDKTRLQVGQRILVTGLSIGSGKIRLPKKMRRRFKNDAFIATNAVEHPDQLANLTDPLFFERALGQLAYWRNIEPYNEDVQNLWYRMKNAQYPIGDL